MKTEFNLQKNMVDIYYHYKEGKITAKHESFNREELLGHAKLGDLNEKDVDTDKT